MRKVLVIGEKTSQVKKFATVLCGNYKSQEQAKYVWSYTGIWSMTNPPIEFTFLPLAGHITTLETPSGYKWGECPPIKLITDNNAIVVKNQKKYVTILRKQIKLKDELWLALDPDSEGDNIALEVVNILSSIIKKNKIPVKRIWNSSLTNSEIIRAFLHPKPWSDELALGVQGRRLIDAWLGFAGTREITRAARRVAKVKVLSVGRVQLPTLFLIIQADLAHEMFEIKDRWKLTATFKPEQHENYDGDHSIGFVDKEEQLRQIITDIGTETQGIITDISQKSTKTGPPVPHNTTAAVSLLSKVMKVKADQALELMVELYNRGLLSYPRTENKKFKDDFPHKEIISKLTSVPELIPFITKLVTSKQVRNNGPVKGAEEDHDPIHPTGETKDLQFLDAKHRKAWDILTRYYLSLFMEDLITSQVRVVTKINNHEFLTEGRSITQQGWREIQWWVSTKVKDIPALQKQQPVDLVKLKAIKSQTKPPNRFTDSQLLLEMEKANIGTKSSRPDIIKKLEERKYVLRQGQTLISTVWGRVLIASLAPIWPKVITPEFTSHVEELMDKVATGQEQYNSMIDTLRQEYLNLHQELLPKLGIYQHLLKEFNLENQLERQKNPKMIDNTKINKLLEKILVEPTFT